MKKFALATVLIAMTAILSINSYAHDMKKQGSKDCDKKQHGRMHDQRHQMMLEGQDIMLQTIKLLKETVKDKDTAAKADALEKRMIDLIDRHKDMHEKMMKEMDECDWKMEHSHEGRMKHQPMSEDIPGGTHQAK